MPDWSRSWPRPVPWWRSRESCSGTSGSGRRVPASSTRPGPSIPVGRTTTVPLIVISGVAIATLGSLIVRGGASTQVDSEGPVGVSPAPLDKRDYISAR